MARTIRQLEEDYLVKSLAPSAPIFSANSSVTPILDGDAYFANISQAMAKCTGAGDVVYIVSWLFSTGLVLLSGTDPLDLRLVELAALGVDVRVILWSNRTLQALESSDTMADVPEDEFRHWRTLLPVSSPLRGFVEIVHSNSRAAYVLRNALSVKKGGTPLADRVLLNWSGTHGDHSKYAIVKAGSEVTGFVGGIDFHPSRAGAPHHASSKWHDAGVTVKGGAVAGLWADFATRWDEVSTLSPRELRRRNLLGTTITEPFNPSITATPIPPAPAPPPAGGHSAQIVRTYGRFKERAIWSANVLSFMGDEPWGGIPRDGLQEILSVLSHAISSATRYVYIEDQGPWTAVETLYSRLAYAANQGVKVIMVTSGKADPADPVTTSNDALRSTMERELVKLLEEFARINFVCYTVLGVTVHSKVVLIDDRFMCVGSANFWDDALNGEGTEELNVAAVCTDATVIDFRARLWTDHLRLDSADPAVKADLADLTKSLAVWRPEWGTGLSMPTPNSALQRAWPAP